MTLGFRKWPSGVTKVIMVLMFGRNLLQVQVRVGRLAKSTFSVEG